MKIRAGQMAALRTALLPAFLERLGAHLRLELGEDLADLDEGALREQLERTVRRAAEHGLVTEADLATFARLATVFGWDFYQQEPWVAEYFADSALSPTQRLQRVAARFHQTLVRAVRSDAARAAFGKDQ